VFLKLFDSVMSLLSLVVRYVTLLVYIGTAPTGDMLIYAQGMYIMHVPFNPTQENPGSQTLYIPGSMSKLIFITRVEIRSVERITCICPIAVLYFAFTRSC